MDLLIFRFISIIICGYVKKVILLNCIYIVKFLICIYKKNLKCIFIYKYIKFVGVLIKYWFLLLKKKSIYIFFYE